VVQIARAPKSIEPYYTSHANSFVPVGRNKFPALRARGLAGLGDAGTPIQLTGTPSQIVAMMAANITVPSNIDPNVSTDPVAVQNAVALLNQQIPTLPVLENLSPPTVSGSVHTALSGIDSTQYFGSRGLGGLGAMGYAISPSAAGSTIASSVMIAEGFTAWAGPVGLAVGVVIGVIMGLFGHKVRSPPTTQAQRDQAAQFIAQYRQIAGTCIGRAYPTTAMQDIAMAFCIDGETRWNNAGGCHNQDGIRNTWAEQLSRLNTFFSAMQSASVGSMVTIRDTPSLPGHGKTDMSVTFEFPNPGVNAPNYILGPLYAQYFYTMCNIFNNEYNCTGLQLTAPVPQFYCDLIDWFRAQHPQWDIPAGTIDAPVEYVDLSLQPGQITTKDSTPAVPVLTLEASGVNPNVIGASLTINPGGTATESGGSIGSTALTNSNPILQAGQPPPSMSAHGVTVAASLGISNQDLWLLGGAAVVLLLLYRMKA
jgi:hypothetical protein